MNSIDLNADLGEGAGQDLELLNIVSSASVACGGHAGDDLSMAATLAGAKKAGVITGAHPGFVDRENFGRKALDISCNLVAEQVVQQIDLIRSIAEKIGQKISYVKLHGALYNLASTDFSYAKTIFLAIKKSNPDLAIMALDNSAQLAAASELGFKVIAEAFADRAYKSERQLLARGEAGAVFSETEQAVAQALSIGKDRKITNIEGVQFSSNARSICLHGDNAQALKLALAIKTALQQAGIKIAAPV